MEKVRIGMIGMGRMGITHYSIVNTHPAVEIVSVSDTSELILSMLKKYLPKLETYTDYKKQLNKGNLDGIIVCTPSPLHHPVCKLAAEKGISVFCEKPFTTDPAQAGELADLFEKKGLVNQVGYVYRFDSVFRKVKQLLNDCAIGKVCHVNADFLSGTIVKPQSGKGWRAKRENGGGALFEMGSHVIDLLEFFFGKPEKLVGSFTNQIYSVNVEDVVSADLRYANGVTASLHVNWCDYTYRKPMMKLDFHGDKGKIQCDLYGLKIYLLEENKELGLSKGWTTIPMNMIPDPTPYYVRGTNFTNQLYAFVDAILENRKTTGCLFREAADTQMVIKGIFNNDK